MAPLHSSLLALSLGLAAGMPTFYINLDLPPRKRWIEVAHYYREEILSMARTLNPLVTKYLGDMRDEWAKIAHYDEDSEEEMHGFVESLNHSNISFDRMRVNLLLYEMASPTMGCSGVLWAMKNGTVVHGRNMDYEFRFRMPDGRELNWPDVTFQSIFVKKGVPIIKAVGWPGGIGFHTAMRIGGWSFQQNTHLRDNEWHLNLKAGQLGGQAYNLVARKIMESTPHFKDAVRKLAAARFMAPSFFLVSGKGAGEGAVITVHRVTHGKHTPRAEIRTLSTSSRGWYLVQTNDDSKEPPLDDRRPVTMANLAVAKQDMISPEHMMQFMQTPPLLSWATVFSTVMVPATGHFNVSLPRNSHGPIDPQVLGRSSLAQKGDPEVIASLRGVRRHG